jgi:hypothetical protein
MDTVRIRQDDWRRIGGGIEEIGGGTLEEQELDWSRIGVGLE